MDTNDILNKFITSMLNVDIQDIESFTIVDTNDNEIIIDLKLVRKEADVCPSCGNVGVVHGYNKKKLIHSIFTGRNCSIIFHQRRYMCKKCDLTFSEKSPLSKRNERMTYETKVNILIDLKRNNVTYNQTAQRHNVSPTEVQRIFDKHVNIEPHKLPTTLSIDEHFFPSSDHDGLYMFVMMDFQNGEIIDIYPDRRKDYLISRFSDIKNKTLNIQDHTSELSNVKYISMDLNDIYRRVCKTYFPKATICADEFHVIKNLTKLCDDVRIRLRGGCNDSTLIYLLTKFKYVINIDTNLDNEKKYNKKLGRYINLRGIQEILFDAFPELKEAYDLKIGYINFNRTAILESAKEELNKQIEAFGNCNIKEYKIFYNLLKNWNKEIINSFIIVDGKRINNSHIESINRQIDRLMYNANGYINFKRARNRIMYCINKKDTYKM